MSIYFYSTEFYFITMSWLNLNFASFQTPFIFAIKSDPIILGMICSESAAHLVINKNLCSTHRGRATGVNHDPDDSPFV